MEQTWRWYGPNDPVSLKDIRQAGATGIVTALHEIPIGEVWTLETIEERKRTIEWDDSVSPAQPRGLTWSVIESIPVHEDIKQGKPNRDEWIKKYKESIRNVGKAGIPVLTYNWMPVVDWTRTNLEMQLDDGALALAFNYIDFAAFDMFILKRDQAENDYSEEIIKKAKSSFSSMSEEQKYILQKNIIAGLPGGQEGYDIESFRNKLSEYKDINSEKYRQNLKYFLEQIIPLPWSPASAWRFTPMIHRFHSLAFQEWLAPNLTCSLSQI